MATPPPAPDGAAFLQQLVRHRRATAYFTAEPVPSAVITRALQIASEAPSGYNLQPWRFILVRDAARRARLREAAMDQPKITEAPLVIVACAERDGWQSHLEEIFATAAQLTGPSPDLETRRRTTLAFLDTLPREVWLNRQVMLAFTYLMLAFEAQGWDTAPMEGFSPAAVRQVVNLPDDAVVIALLAVGRAAAPDALHPGRLPLTAIASAESFGQPLPSS